MIQTITVCPMIHKPVEAVKPDGSGVIFRRRFLYRAGLFRSCNVVLHASCLHAVSDDGMPFAAMTGCNSSGPGMKVYEVRLGITVHLCVSVLSSKAQARCYPPYVPGRSMPSALESRSADLRGDLIMQT